MKYFIYYLPLSSKICSNYFYSNEHLHTPTLASILSSQYLFFYSVQLEWVNPLTHRNNCQ